jgi:hypothetical protein
MDRPVPQVSLKERRERTIQALCEHFAHDHLEVETFEARLDLAHRSRAAADLDALLADLPALPKPAPARSMNPTRLVGDPDHVRDMMERSGRAVREAVRDTRTLVAMLGGVERRGEWTPARKNIILAVMGGAELDFRDVHFPPGETEVFVLALMGGVEIIVPPGLNVDSNGIAIMGGFGHVSPPGRREGDAPTLRVHGLCVMGGVDIQIRLPGETAGQARARQREEYRSSRSRRRLPGRE